MVVVKLSVAVKRGMKPQSTNGGIPKRKASKASALIPARAPKSILREDDIC